VFAILSQGLCAMAMTLTSFRDLAHLHRHEVSHLHRAFGVAALIGVPGGRRPGLAAAAGLDFAYPLLPVSYILSSRRLW